MPQIIGVSPAAILEDAVGALIQVNADDADVGESITGLRVSYNSTNFTLLTEASEPLASGITHTLSSLNFRVSLLPDYNGTVDFTLQALSDGPVSNEGIVVNISIPITPQRDFPFVQSITLSPAELIEDSVGNIVTLHPIDGDLGDAILSVQVAYFDTAFTIRSLSGEVLPPGEILTLTGDYRFLLDLTPNYNGDVVFGTIVTSTSESSSPQTHRLSITPTNDPPVVVQTGISIFEEDTTPRQYSLIGSDVDGELITRGRLISLPPDVQISTLGGTVLAAGDEFDSLTLNFLYVGSLAYTTRTVEFDFLVIDGANAESEVATQSITIIRAVRPPDISSTPSVVVFPRSNAATPDYEPSPASRMGMRLPTHLPQKLSPRRRQQVHHGTCWARS